MAKSIQQWISEFKSSVSNKDITIDWDSGHCYSGLNNPVITAFEQVTDQFTSEEVCQFEDATNDWLSGHEPQLFCAPFLTPEISNGYVSCECFDGQDVDHVLGFIDLVEEFSPENREWYHLEDMKKWVAAQQILKIQKS